MKNTYLQDVKTTYLQKYFNIVFDIFGNIFRLFFHIFQLLPELSLVHFLFFNFFLSQFLCFFQLAHAFFFLSLLPVLRRY